MSTRYAQLDAPLLVSWPVYVSLTLPRLGVTDTVHVATPGVVTVQLVAHWLAPPGPATDTITEWTPAPPKLVPGQPTEPLHGIVVGEFPSTTAEHVVAFALTRLPVNVSLVVPVAGATVTVHVGGGPASGGASAPVSAGASVCASLGDESTPASFDVASCPASNGGLASGSVASFGSTDPSGARASLPGVPGVPGPTVAPSPPSSSPPIAAPSAPEQAAARRRTGRKVRVEPRVRLDKRGLVRLVAPDPPLATPGVSRRVCAATLEMRLFSRTPQALRRPSRGVPVAETGNPEAPMNSTRFGLAGLFFLGSLAPFVACSAGSNGASSSSSSTSSSGGPSDAADDLATADGPGGGDSGTSDSPADTPIDHGTGIACSPLPGVSLLYYSRSPIPQKIDGELWVVGGDGSNDTKLGIGRHPRLSPDKTHLLFLRDNANWWQANLYLRDLSNSADTLVFTNTDSLLGFDWRADSQTIVFDAQCDIYAANRDGTAKQILVNYREADCYSDYPSLSPADGRVAFHNFYDGLVVAGATGAGAAHVPNTMSGADYPTDGVMHAAADMFATWSPDGQWLAFLAIPPATQYQPGSQGIPYKIKTDGSGRTNLVPGLDAGDGFFPGGVVSPDGTRYINAGIYQGVQGIYAVPLDGSGAVTRVCTSPGAPIYFVGTALP